VCTKYNFSPQRTYTSASPPPTSPASLPYACRRFGRTLPSVLIRRPTLWTLYYVNSTIERQLLPKLFVCLLCFSGCGWALWRVWTGESRGMERETTHEHLLHTGPRQHDLRPPHGRRLGMFRQGHLYPHGSGHPELHMDVNGSVNALIIWPTRCL